MTGTTTTAITMIFPQVVPGISPPASMNQPAAERIPAAMITSPSATPHVRLRVAVTTISNTATGRNDEPLMPHSTRLVGDTGSVSEEASPVPNAINMELNAIRITVRIALNQKR